VDTTPRWADPQTLYLLSPDPVSPYRTVTVYMSLKQFIRFAILHNPKLKLNHAFATFSRFFVSQGLARLPNYH